MTGPPAFARRGGEALSPALAAFVRDVERLCARQFDLPALLAELARLFRELLAVPGLLPSALEGSPNAGAPQPERGSYPAGYTQHLLYATDRGPFSLVALVWRPGARTPVHDHLTWGLAGVYCGVERETRYRWVDRPGGRSGLQPVATRELGQGEVVPILPPEDIHRVENPTAALAVSLHLYGLDLRATPRVSSVRRIYPAALLLPAAEAAGV
jgi:predicted metal-dependent enzyme (double-stranded beta helix superfamily)